MTVPNGREGILPRLIEGETKESFLDYWQSADQGVRSQGRLKFL